MIPKNCLMVAVEERTVIVQRTLLDLKDQRNIFHGNFSQMLANLALKKVKMVLQMVQDVTIVANDYYCCETIVAAVVEKWWPTHSNNCQ